MQPAVVKGVAYLLGKVPDLDRIRLGYAGLNGLALLECGIPPDHPAILYIAEQIRKRKGFESAIYDLSTCLFFLNRLDELQPLNHDDREMARSLALRIISGQFANGIWGYSGRILTREQEAALVKSLEKGIYKPTGDYGPPSMSNTQFAMLAVWGARKYGVPVREPLLALAAYFHTHQLQDGQWIYPGNSLAATSTCVGLIALAIERVLLKEPGAESRAPAGGPRADVKKAFSFVARTIGRKKGDPGGGTTLRYGGALFDADAWGDIYFLWTLERLGMIYSTETIDGKAWFDWGYPILLEAQNKTDGSWFENHRLSDQFGPLAHTPFALLFLQRANLAKDLTARLKELQLSAGNQNP